MPARLSRSTAEMADICTAFASGLRASYGSNDARAVAHLVQAIKPLLGGFAPEVQSAVLADLTAIWLAGYQGTDAGEWRDQALLGYLGLVHDLIGPNEQALMAQIPPKGSA
jgi:hypothetical protein